MAGEAAGFTAHARGELAKVIVGQRDVLDQLLAVLLCGGHALVEGVPGTAKTLAIKALARICRLEFQRVQCTPDLMPADILGANIFNLASSTFSLHRGPVFTDLLLVDEVNRMPPRTQAALLESMEEQQVTVNGINTNVAELTRIGQSNATAAEEITATMLDLSKLAERSRVDVDEFKKVGL